LLTDTQLAGARALFRRQRHAARPRNRHNQTDAIYRHKETINPNFAVPPNVPFTSHFCQHPPFLAAEVEAAKMAVTLYLPLTPERQLRLLDGGILYRCLYLKDAKASPTFSSFFTSYVTLYPG
jgi:hypothetical protein